MNRTSFTAQFSSTEHADTENTPTADNAPPADAVPAPRRTQLLRLAGSWLGFSGLYAATGGTCPFCGQAACPTGFLSAGIAGGILALCLQAWKRFGK